MYWTWKDIMKAANLKLWVGYFKEVIHEFVQDLSEVLLKTLNGESESKVLELRELKEFKDMDLIKKVTKRVNNLTYYTELYNKDSV